MIQQRKGLSMIVYFWIEKKVDAAIRDFKIDCETDIANSSEAVNMDSPHQNSSQDGGNNRKSIFPDSSRLESFIKKLPFGRA